VYIALLNFHKAVRSAPEAVIFMFTGIGLVSLYFGGGSQFFHLLLIMFLKIDVLAVEF